MCLAFTPSDRGTIGTGCFRLGARADVGLPCDVAKDHDAIRDEARELLQLVEAKSVEYDPDRKVCNVLFLSTPRSRRCRTPLHVSVPAHISISF